jgi:hypothetical protein
MELALYISGMAPLTVDARGGIAFYYKMGFHFTPIADYRRPGTVFPHAFLRADYSADSI